MSTSLFCNKCFTNYCNVRWLFKKNLELIIIIIIYTHFKIKLTFQLFNPFTSFFFSLLINCSRTYDKRFSFSGTVEGSIAQTICSYTYLSVLFQIDMLALFCTSKGTFTCVYIFWSVFTCAYLVSPELPVLTWSHLSYLCLPVLTWVTCAYLFSPGFTCAYLCLPGLTCAHLSYLCSPVQV